MDSEVAYFWKKADNAGLMKTVKYVDDHIIQTAKSRQQANMVC